VGGATTALFETPTLNAVKLAPTSEFMQWGSWFVPLDDRPPVQLFPDPTRRTSSRA
jgi:hypothetical protein